MDVNEIISPPAAITTRLHRVIATACSIDELMADKAFTGLEKIQGSTPAIAQEWADIVGYGDVAKLDAFLEFMGWNKTTFLSAVQSEVIVDDPDLLPDWARALKKVFQNLSDFCTTLSHPGNKQGNSVESILLPFVKMAEAHVIAESDRLDLGITYHSGAQMVQAIGRRLVTLSVSVLDNEIYLNSIIPSFAAGDKTKDLASFEAWLQRIEHYPVLGRLLAVAYTNWADSITEFLERLSHDREMIAKTFFNTDNLGLLVDYSGDAGDVHCNGRSVALLTFSGGRKLVYKPKNLQIANDFFGLITELNTVLPLNLATRRITVMGDYTWEEFITHKECNDTSEFPAFFRRMGMLTRLFQLCGARDFWLDNLVAHGDQPVFVDLEMVIQHIKETGKDLLPSEQKALQEVEESVIKIGIISFPTPIGMGVKAEDLGTLAAIKPFSSPFKLSLAADNNISIGINKSDAGYITWEKTDYLPSVKGIFALSSDYMEDFQQGYADMNHALVCLKDKLLAENSCLYKFSDALLRYIHRDTWTYMRIIKISTHSQNLVGGIIRDKSLFSLFKEVWENNKLNREKATLLANEIASMHHLDIPLFTATGGSIQLVVDTAVFNYFDHSALDLMIGRLRSIDSFDIKKNQQIVASTFYCGDHAAPTGGYKETVGQVPIPDWAAQAKACASLIMNQAIKSPQGDMAWIGLDYQSHIGTYMLEVLKPDLLSGTCGLSMMFTDLYRAYGLEDYKTYASGSLASTLSVVKNSIANFIHLDLVWGTTDKPLLLGAYAGIGSQIIALEYAARHLQSAEAMSALQLYVNAIPLEQLRKYTSPDFISGYSGLLFSLHGLKPAWELAELTRHSFESKSVFPEYARPLEVLPSLKPGYDYLNQIMEGQSGNFSFEQDPDMGTLFTALEYRYDQNSADVYQAFLSRDTRQLTTQQLIDYAELALNLSDITGDGQYLVQAKHFAAEIVSRKEQTGEWFADSWASDIHLLSVIHGTGALCHLFLRLDQIGKFGSFRRLNSFKKSITK
ncbi:type 2 lantibiotic biosynthesis protein LanM [Chryseobacterium shigense]|uniref:Type 2 lantibiotic biosynthesis protein LanM n=1 Tax=Chryseobacterium shigense TaxID=297244 RepID=A0A1N7HZ13_9FLAO|nr:type 2 lanthipeptide synthetase LanM [Chryseobacterium shigense]SIS30087.1 type 2 lantibiotic biosynthesis protein LanM [Chryseobacterium shigense]